MIAQAAIRTEHGTVYSLPPPARHHTLLQLMKDEGVDREIACRADQGFLDDDGNFLERDAAYVIAKAAGQLIARKGGYMQGEINHGPDLFSEDMW